jgi:hypothetical protein
VKDFVKKVKLEDNKIEIRQKTLARQAERIAAARAKAATGTPMPNAQETTAEQAKTATSAPATGGSLHPSLPAKPGSTSSAKAPPESQAQPTPTPTPPPPTPAPVVSERLPTPAPVTTPPDEQILKLEEVMSLLHVKLCNDRAI